MRRVVLAFAFTALAMPALALRVEPLAWTPGPGTAQPSLAATADGTLLLNWQRRSGDETALQVARFAPGAPAPQPASTVAEGRGWFVNWADFPAVVVLDNGDWVTWTLRKSAASGYAYDIHLQRSTDGGRQWSPPRAVGGSGLPVQHGFVAGIAEGGDRVRLVWLDGREGHDPGAAADHGAHGTAHEHEEGRMTLRSAVVGRDGVAHDERRLDADTCSCCQTDLVRRGGELQVLYRDHAGGIRDIATIRRTADGRWQAPVPVHVDGWRMPGCPVNGPAGSANGDALAVLWPTMAAGPMDVRLAISPREGEPYGEPIVLEQGDGVLGRVDLVPWGAGFLASWVGGDARGAVLRVAVLDAKGRERERADVVRLPPGRQLGHPRLAVGKGRAMVAWTEPQADGPRVRVAWVE